MCFPSHSWSFRQRKLLRLERAGFEIWSFLSFLFFIFMILIWFPQREGQWVKYTMRKNIWVLQYCLLFMGWNFGMFFSLICCFFLLKLVVEYSCLDVLISSAFGWDLLAQKLAVAGQSFYVSFMGFTSNKQFYVNIWSLQN